MVGVKRWCFTTCALFMLCPRRSYIAASPSKYWSNSNKVPISKSYDLHGKPFTGRRFNIVRDKVSTSTLDEAEPGFDFNEEEMKKLKIWPGGAIPYYIDQFSFDKVFRDRIRTFLDLTNGVTGLNFLELHRPPDDDKARWVFFVNRQGLLSCADHPFRNFTSDGVQKILLGYDCLSTGGELAEIVLALVGVPPQHNAPDRDKYIRIEKENVMPGKAYLFEILKNNEWLFHGVDYDFASAGHYPLHKYTVNGKATINPVRNQEIAIGEEKSFSYTDVWKIRMIYNYISKKRLKSANIPECNKLFDLGTNFSNYVHESEDDVKPRKKPNKYLGLPDETVQSPEHSQETKNKTKTKPPSNNKNVNIEESTEKQNPDKEHDIEDDNQKSHKTKQKPKPKNVSSKEKYEKDTEKHDITDENPLMSLPDFETDDRNLKSQGLKFTKPGKGK